MAAAELLDEGGLPAVTIETVSARSGVSKPTIYRYWPNRTAVAIEAFAQHMAGHVPLAGTGDPRRDLAEQVRRVAAFYQTKAGTVFAQLLAATVTDPQAAGRLRDQFLADRRADVTRLWQRAVDLGQARPGIGADIAIDVLFSPIVYRLLVGHAPFGPAEAAQLADAALGGLLNPAGPLGFQFFDHQLSLPLAPIATGRQRREEVVGAALLGIAS
jgi:AcrR family transcriptional regulator